MGARIRIGDVFEIPLSDGRKAFGQYVFRDKMGPIIRIFDRILDKDEKLALASLDSNLLRFPPVITGLFAAIRSGLWKRVGKLPTDTFQYPNFVSRIKDTGSGLESPWFLWKGKDFIALGHHLPSEYRTLERLVVWEPTNLVRRIEIGENPYAHSE